MNTIYVQHLALFFQSANNKDILGQKICIYIFVGLKSLQILKEAVDMNKKANTCHFGIYNSLICGKDILDAACCPDWSPHG